MVAKEKSSLFTQKSGIAWGEVSDLILAGGHFLHLLPHLDRLGHESIDNIEKLWKSCWQSLSVNSKSFSPALTHVPTIVFLQQLKSCKLSTRAFSLSNTCASRSAKTWKHLEDFAYMTKCTYDLTCILKRQWQCLGLCSGIKQRHLCRAKQLI